MTPTKIQFEAYQNTFDYFNKELFEGKLPHVFLNFSRRAKAYGFFAPKRWNSNGTVCHEISLNPSLLKRPIIEVCSTLVHEQCHLKIEEDGKASKNGYHSKVWADLMEQVGLMPSSTGYEGGKRTGLRVSHYIIPGGRFEVAFNNIPKEYLLPMVCDDLELRKVQPQARSKYSCEPCNVKVYGKPELSIKCGLCGSEMYEFRK
ncbi:MAG TPA: SprT-like domain-containing protein [Legionellaceae bacterium]|nr:SprT-like domain-containing protein [Legionellaceae bacterium]